MVEIGRKIKEAVGAVDNLRKFEKFSKLKASYVEHDKFTNSNLHQGYFCYNCIYFIKDNHCAIVEDTGPDVNGQESGIIAPHGLCTLWDPNEEEAR